MRIGTRGSDLALWQAHHVAGRLRAAGAETELVVLKTRGDLIDDVPLSKVEGKAFFTAEIERALLAERVDLAVHSHKDLALESPPGLAIVAVPERAATAERLLIAPAAHEPAGTFLPLAMGARVGTSAPRRAEQLRALRPDLEVLDLRGNVPTRVRRLREGRYDAILLAAAGLDRLELDTGDLVVIALPPDLFVPAPAQGALAIQARAADGELAALCRAHLHDESTARAVAAERQTLAWAGGGCSLPLGAATEPAGDGSWRAHLFLGAGHPEGTAEAPARWAQAEGADPAAAVRAAFERMAAGGPTGAGPLAGTTVALAGSSAGGTELGARLATLGADVVHERLIELEDLPCPDLARRIAELAPGDALAVTSRRAAERLEGARPAPGVVVAAVGRATARALESAGLPVDVVGSAGALDLARALELREGARVLFPCAEEALPDLPRELEARGHPVERLPLYRTRAVAGIALAAGADVRIYMSPSSVRAALEWERAQPDRRTLLIALGATTLEALEREDLSAVRASGAGTATHESVVAHLAQYVTQAGHVTQAEDVTQAEETR